MPPETDDRIEGAPAENTPEPQPDPTREELARLRAENEQIRRAQEQTNSLLAAAFSQSNYTSNRAPEPERAPISVDDDPDLTDDEKKVLRKAEERLRREMEERERRLIQSYTSNRNQEMQRWSSLSRDQVYRELEEAGMGDLKPKIEEYISRNNVPHDYLSQPGAFRVIASTILGEQELERRREEARRGPSLGSSIGRSARPNVSDEPRAGRDEVEYLRGYGIDASPEEIEFLINQGKRKDGFSAAEYNEFRSKRRAS